MISLIFKMFSFTRADSDPIFNYLHKEEGIPGRVMVSKLD